MNEADLDTLQRLASEEPVVAAYLETAKGSTPRNAGTLMLVTRNGVVGTIGGGEAERRTIETAREILASAKDPHTASPVKRLELALGPALDQCCGGHMTVALSCHESPLEPPFALWEGGPEIAAEQAAPVIIYGAGHVGAALARALLPLPFSVTLIDPRAESLWPTPGLQCQRLVIPETAAAAAPQDAAHLVMTHSHAVDLEIVAAALARPARFVGLIGSATKRATFSKRLRERGVDPERLVCPIGLPEIRSKQPEVIAASVAAQLLALPPFAEGRVS